MRNINNKYIISIDGLGIGKCDDARSFKSMNADTLKSLSETNGLNLKTMKQLGLGLIKGVSCLELEMFPIGQYGRMISTIKTKNKGVIFKEFLNIDKSEIKHYNPVGVFTDEFINVIQKIISQKIIVCRTSVLSNVILEYNAKHLKNKKPMLFTTGKSDLVLAINTNVISPKKALEMFTLLIKELSNTKYSFAEYRLFLYREHSIEDGKYTVINNTVKYSYNFFKDKALFIGGNFNNILKSDPSIFIKTQGDNEVFRNINKIMNEGKIQNTCIYISFSDMYSNLIKGKIPAAVYSVNQVDKYLSHIIGAIDETDDLIIFSTCGCDYKCLTKMTTREALPFIKYNKKEETRNLGTITVSEAKSFFD